MLKLWTDSESGEKIEVVEASNEIDEAQFILSQLNPTKLSDYAILYRTNAQSRALEEQFLKNGVPYRLYGGVSFYERKEVKDVLSYLKLVNNPKESVALKRAEKLGKGRLSKFFTLYQEISFNLSALTTTELVDRILTATGYLEYLDDGTEEGKNRVDNVKELLSVAETFPALHEFLENVALVENGSIRGKRKVDRENQNAVTMMTMHSAKGLEFPTVFIVGMEEGLFPHSRSMMDMNALEEERRLCYVGITRARHKLVLTYTRSRLFFGTRSNNLVSRFLSEIPEHLIISNSSFRDQDQFLDDISVTRDNDDWLN